MKYIKKYERKEETIDLVFIPSGEIVELTLNEFDILNNDYVVLNYDDKNQCWYIEDNYRDVIKIALNKKF